MELTDLYEKFISEGYNNFYIDGIGGPQADDVHCLGFDNQNWTIYYIERGQKSDPIFLTKEKEEAIKFYSDFVARIEHRHCIVFTRSIKILNYYKQKLEKLHITVIENNIPNFASTNDKVYRLFVVNKDIFLAKRHFKELPCFDSDLKEYRL